MNNNPRFDPSPDSHSADDLRSEINTTRQRMDETIDAISSRLKGRHLLDEAIGFIRRSAANGDSAKLREKAGDLREKAGESAGAAVHAMVDTVKAHPLPALLIGAGVGWLLYEKSRASRPEEPDYDPDYDARHEAGHPTGWEEDVPYDYPPAEYEQPPTGLPGSEGFYEEGGPESQARRRLSRMKERLSGKAAAARERGRERTHAATERLQSGYSSTRHRVASTVEDRPLETGIACLALGVIAGLLTPVPRAVSERAGPAARRLREKARESGREWMGRGRHVAEAALAAAREEAESQGLTPGAMGQKARSVADRAKGAAAETAREEGVEPSGSAPGGSPPPGSSPSSMPGGVP